MSPPVQHLKCFTRSLYQFVSSKVSASVLLVKLYANEAKSMTSANTPPFRRYYIIRKIKDDTCVYDINQNQILSTARTFVSERPVLFNDTVRS